MFGTKKTINFVNNDLSNEDKQLVFKTTRKFNASDLDFIKENLIEYIEKVLSEDIDYSILSDGTYHCTSFELLEDEGYKYDKDKDYTRIYYDKYYTTNYRGKRIFTKHMNGKYSENDIEDDIDDEDDIFKSYYLSSSYFYCEKEDNNCKYLPSQQCIENYIIRSLHIHKNYDQLLNFFLSKGDLSYIIDDYDYDSKAKYIDYTYNFNIIDDDETYKKIRYYILDTSLLLQNNQESYGEIPLPILMREIKKSKKETLKEKIIFAFFRCDDDRQYNGPSTKADLPYEYDDIYDDVYHHKIKVVDCEISDYEDDTIDIYVELDKN